MGRFSLCFSHSTSKNTKDPCVVIVEFFFWIKNCYRKVQRFWPQKKFWWLPSARLTAIVFKVIINFFSLLIGTWKLKKCICLFGIGHLYFWLDTWFFGSLGLELKIINWFYYLWVKDWSLIGYWNHIFGTWNLDAILLGCIWLVNWSQS